MTYIRVDHRNECYHTAPPASEFGFSIMLVITESHKWVETTSWIFLFENSDHDSPIYSGKSSILFKCMLLWDLLLSRDCTSVCHYSQCKKYTKNVRILKWPIYRGAFVNIMHEEPNKGYSRLSRLWVLKSWWQGKNPVTPLCGKQIMSLVWGIFFCDTLQLKVCRGSRLYPPSEHPRFRHTGMTVFSLIRTMCYNQNNIWPSCFK